MQRAAAVLRRAGGDIGDFSKFFLGGNFFLDLCGTQNIPTFWACFNVMSYFKGEITPEYNTL